MTPKLYALSTLAVSLGSFILGIFVLTRSFKYKLYKTWFYFCVSVGFWSLGYYFTQLDIAKDLALLCSRLSHASGALIPLFFNRFIFIWLDIKKHKTSIFLYSSCIILAILSLTQFIVIDIIPKLFFKYYPI